MTTGSYMAGKMPEHNLLTPGYWRDSVRYEGKTVPGGTIGCEALNLSDVLGKIGTGKPASSGNRSGDW